MHLLLPLLASLLFVCGLICIKRTNAQGVSPWTVTFLANQWAAIVFSLLWFLGGDGQPATQLWQPAIVASLYICGQVFTFSALRFGDVSLATPIFGSKVVIVAFLVTFVLGQALGGKVWVGAIAAMIGIGLVQWTPKRREGEDGTSPSRRATALTVGLAVSAALAFALFDLAVQSWAPAWGAGRFLPIVYWIVALMSLGFLPWFQRSLVWQPNIRTLLLPGTLLIALQAVCIVFTLSRYEDAARINVVYSLRALWGVVLAWLAARIWGGSEAGLPKQILVARFSGASLLTIAVVLVILAK